MPDPAADQPEEPPPDGPFPDDVVVDAEIVDPDPDPDPDTAVEPEPDTQQPDIDVIDGDALGPWVGSPSSPDPASELVDVVDPDGAMADPPDVPPDDVDLPTALAERDQYLALARQVQADFENYRKRAQAQQADAEARGGARIAEYVLPVLDACDGAIIHGVVGVTPIYKALFEAMAKAGLDVIPAEGEPFDPNQHEAVVHEPGDGGVATVVETLRTGYTWHGKVLRAAMVKVRD